jgi:type III secretion apparatus needle protein
MVFYAPQSMFNLENVTTAMGNGVQQLEQQLYSAMSQLQNNPNPSAGDLVIFQAQLLLWSNLIQMESSITKIYGDTMKQIVTNMGS